MDNFKLPESVHRWDPHMHYRDDGRQVISFLIYPDGKWINVADIPAIIAANQPPVAESVEQAISNYFQQASNAGEWPWDELATAAKALRATIAADKQAAVDMGKEALVTAHRSHTSSIAAIERREKLAKEKLADCEAALKAAERERDEFREIGIRACSDLMAAQRRLAELEKAGPEEIQGLVENFRCAVAAPLFMSGPELTAELPSAKQIMEQHRAALLSAIGAMQDRIDAFTEYVNANESYANTIGHPEATVEDERKAEARLMAALNSARAALGETK